MTRFLGSWINGALPIDSTRPEPYRWAGGWIYWRGYLANRRELAQALGVPRKNCLDTELLICAYEAWGERLSQHVLGEYALVLGDEHHGRLFLTHDSFGICPLFYRRCKGGLEFSSHLADLAAGLGLTDLDHDYIADYLACAQAVDEKTPYRDCRRLAPGSALICDGDRTIVVTNSLDPARISPNPLPATEMDRQLRQVLNNAVSAACPPEGAWAELSGGLDSSSVVGSAISAGLPVEALSVVYPHHPAANEEPWMHAVIQTCQIPWHRLSGDQFAPFSELPLQRYAEPSTVPLSASLNRAYEQTLATQKTKVVLTGLGGDLVFHGDQPEPLHLADTLKRLRLGETWTAARRYQNLSAERRSMSYWLVFFGLFPLLRFSFQRRVSNAGTLPSWLDAGYRKRWSLAERAQCRRAPLLSNPSQQGFHDTLWDLSHLISTSRDQYTDSFSFRHPLLHRPLVELMLGTTPLDSSSAGTDRTIQRRALHDYLPPQVLERRGKRGPVQLFEQGLRGNQAWLELLLKEPRVVSQGYVCPDRWRQAVSQACFGRCESLRHFHAVVGLEHWLRMLDEPCPA